jgi:hypothetical protein
VVTTVTGGLRRARGWWWRGGGVAAAVDCSAGGRWYCGDVEVDSDRVVALCLCSLVEKREGRGVFMGGGAGLAEGLGFRGASA